MLKVHRNNTPVIQSLRIQSCDSPSRRQVGRSDQALSACIATMSWFSQSMMLNFPRNLAQLRHILSAMSPRSRSPIRAHPFETGQLLIYKRGHGISFFLCPTSTMSPQSLSFNPSHSSARPTQQYPPPPSSGPGSGAPPQRAQFGPSPPTADPRGPPPRISQQASIPVRCFAEIIHDIYSHHLFLVCGTGSGGLLPLNLADASLTL